MTSRRVLKAAQAVRQVVSMAILAELKDPRVRNVTVTQVEMSPDMRSAKVYVSVMGDETQARLTLRGLQNSAGFLQKRIKDQIDTRYIPRLEFVLDQGVKQSIAVARILREVLPPGADAETDPDQHDAGTGKGHEISAAADEDEEDEEAIATNTSEPAAEDDDGEPGL